MIICSISECLNIFSLKIVIQIIGQDKYDSYVNVKKYN